MLIVGATRLVELEWRRRTRAVDVWVWAEASLVLVCGDGLYRLQWILTYMILVELHFYCTCVYVVRKWQTFVRYFMRRVPFSTSTVRSSIQNVS